MGAACTDFPCHSERSIEDAESKNPFLLMVQWGELACTPPPSVRTGHLPSRGGFGAAGELVRRCPLNQKSEIFDSIFSGMLAPGKH